MEHPVEVISTIGDSFTGKAIAAAFLLDKFRQFESVQALDRALALRIDNFDLNRRTQAIRELLYNTKDRILGKSIPPRLFFKSITEFPNVTSSDLAQCWENLFATSFSPSGIDETNIIYMDILARMTSADLRLFQVCIRKSLPWSENIERADCTSIQIVPYRSKEFMEDLGWTDRLKIEVSGDHLFSLRLVETQVQTGIGSGLQGKWNEPGGLGQITPTSLGISMYTRCQGYEGSPFDFSKTLMSKSEKSWYDNPAI